MSPLAWSSHFNSRSSSSFKKEGFYLIYVREGVKNLFMSPTRGGATPLSLKNSTFIIFYLYFYLFLIYYKGKTNLKGTVHSSDIWAKSLANGSLMIVL